ncbi:MAG: glycosyltransferase family 2 protein [Candidatus Thorarchaeota archaeon]|nr:glycosyltransferase family 2 protein [Candidatus Thorarchaeota archaeon]
MSESGDRRDRFAAFCGYCKASCSAPPPSSSTYILWTNVYNEVASVPALFRYVAHQTKKPVVWLWVDDGSTDETAEVIAREAANYRQLDVWLERMPKKQKPNFFTLGKTHETVLTRVSDRVDRLGVQYMAILDADTEPCPNYFARLCSIMDAHSDLGAVAGYPVQEQDKLYSGRPMNSGKMIRWQIVRSIGRFWDYCPDSFYNLKAEAQGYRVAVVKVPVRLDRPTTAVVSREGAFRQGRLSFYVGRSLWMVLIRAVWRFLTGKRGRELLQGYLSERARGTWRCTDPDVISHYASETSFRGSVRDAIAILGQHMSRHRTLV